MFLIRLSPFKCIIKGHVYGESGFNSLLRQYTEIEVPNFATGILMPITLLILLFHSTRTEWQIMPESPQPFVPGARRFSRTKTTEEDSLYHPNRYGARKLRLVNAPERWHTRTRIDSQRGVRATRRLDGASPRESILGQTNKKLSRVDRKVT